MFCPPCQPAFQCLHGAMDALWRGRCTLQSPGRLASIAGLGSGRSRRHHAAECAAIHHQHDRRFARWLHLRERESALHPARAGAPTERLWRHRDCDLGKLLRYFGASGAQDFHSAHCRDQDGRRIRRSVRCVDQLCRQEPGQNGAGVFLAKRSAPAQAFCPYTAGKTHKAKAARSNSNRTAPRSIQLRSCNTPGAQPACPKGRC